MSKKSLRCSTAKSYVCHNRSQTTVDERFKPELLSVNLCQQYVSYIAENRVSLIYYARAVGLSASEDPENESVQSVLKRAKRLKRVVVTRRIERNTDA